jgi:hypothetical protein
MLYQQVRGSYVSSESVLKQTIMDLNARGRIDIKLEKQKSKCKVGLVEL